MGVGMANFTFDRDIDPRILLERKVAVVGYGNQGHAHALNLRDSGVNTCVALHAASKSRAKAESDGMTVVEVPEAAQWADAIMFCTPDVPMREIYETGVAEHLREGQALLFAHGFNIHFGQIKPPPFVDVAMVSPKGPGKALRAEYWAGRGLAALVAVAQDASGRAWDVANAYAWGIGCGRVGLLRTTFREETETDLFGEQAVLCGGIPELVKAGFQTLVDAGYQPEVAYFECLHETKLIVDLLYEAGLAGMRKAISDTAEWGGFVAGPEVIGDPSRQAMQAVLERIQSGEFAREWIAENAAGLPRMSRLREEEKEHAAEVVGTPLRQMMFGE
jgi:ketol-acid reductoisomerase